MGSNRVRHRLSLALILADSGMVDDRGSAERHRQVAPAMLIPIAEPGMIDGRDGADRHPAACAVEPEGLVEPGMVDDRDGAERRTAILSPIAEPGRAMTATVDYRAASPSATRAARAVEPEGLVEPGMVAPSATGSLRRRA
jgi:hypothetical protein